MDSGRYVTERQRKVVDRSSSALMESGLYQFYTSFGAYKQKLFERMLTSPEEDDDLQVLTFQQLGRPMVFIFGLWALAIIIFITEHIISKWRKWCNRRNLNPKRHRDLMRLWFLFLYGR